MNEEDYLKWLLKQTKYVERDERVARAITLKLGLYMFVPHGIDINVNEHLGIPAATTVGMSYVISGILFCQWFL